MKCIAVLVAALSLFAGAASAENFSAGSLEIDNPWIRATPRGAGVAGAYMTVVNKGTEADRLMGGSIAGVSRFEVHRMVMDGNVAKMRPSGSRAKLWAKLIGPASPIVQRTFGVRRSQRSKNQDRLPKKSLAIRLQSAGIS